MKKVIIIIIVLVIITVVIGFLALTSNRQEDIRQENNAEVFDDNSTPSSWEIAGIEYWKTYTNEEYGFEFKYPADSEKDIKGNIILNPDQERKYIDVLIKESIFGKCPNNPFPNPYVDPFAQEAERKEKISVKDVDFTKGFYFGRGAESSLWLNVNYSTTKDNQCFYISFSILLDEPYWIELDVNTVEEPKVFNQIVSTFRFLE